MSRPASETIASADDVAFWTPIAFCDVCTKESGDCTCESCPDCGEYWCWCECVRDLV